MTRLTIISFSDGFDPAIITPSFLKGQSEAADASEDVDKRELRIPRRRKRKWSLNGIQHPSCPRRFHRTCRRKNLHPRMLHPPAIRLSHLHPDLEKVIVLCRRFGYLNPVSRHQRSPSQQRKLSFGLFLARQFRVCRDLRRSVNHRNRRGEPVRFIRRVRPRHVVVPYRQGLSRGILLAGRLEERGREITAKLRLIDDSSYRRRAVQTSLPPCGTRE